MKFLRYLLTLCVLFTTISAQQAPFVVADGTPVKLRLSRNLSSADAKVGETVDFEVLEDLVVNEVVVLKKGGVAIASVTQAKSKARMGKAGKLDIAIDYARMVNGEKVALRAVKDTAGGSNTGKMTGAIVATAIVFFPAAPLFLFVKGKDTQIPKGTEITAYVNGEVKLDRAKLTAQGNGEGRPSTDPQSAGGKRSGSGLKNEDVLKLKDAGLSEEIIIAKIDGTPGEYHMETDQLIELKKAGVSDKIIAAMLRAGGSK
ncbi:MAG: PEGA domain-containing protein [Acidobacteria bacterium]|nr:PEGA domain-containing protein [Acidobacteriota bacterium]